MKKIISIVILLVIALSFSACNYDYLLSNKIESLKDEIELLTGKIENLEEKNKELADKIAEMEDYLDNLKNAEYYEILKEFDLTDPKILWTGSIDDNFTDDMVIMLLRKTSTYPELKLRHFGLENAELVEYVGGARPPDYFFEKGYEEALADYRQIVFLHLRQHGKEKVVEAIRHLEKLEFVYCAGPNNIGSGG